MVADEAMVIDVMLWLLIKHDLNQNCEQHSCNLWLNQLRSVKVHRFEKYSPIVRIICQVCPSSRFKKSHEGIDSTAPSYCTPNLGWTSPRTRVDTSSLAWRCSHVGPRMAAPRSCLMMKASSSFPTTLSAWGLPASGTCSNGCFHGSATSRIACHMTRMVDGASELWSDGQLDVDTWIDR